MRPTLSASITLLFSGTGAKNSDMSQTKLQNLFKDLDDFFEDDGTVFKQKVKEVRLEEIRRILSEIQRLDNNNDGSAYSINRRIIYSTFTNASVDSDNLLDHIVLQLTLIDNMYSTQMTRRYYGIGELAEVLFLLSGGSLNTLKYKFLEYLNNGHRHSPIFDFVSGHLKLYKDGSDNRLSNLFSEGYGIGKDAKSKGTAISLISKYAYFLTDFQFPIYDSVVKEMYPKLCNYLFLENMPAIKVTDIARYINAIDSLRNIIGTSATYDAFDRLLWYVGKIHRGNLSLLLNMQDYSAYGAGFDINKSDLAELPFLKNNSILKQIFTLAQKLLVY